MFFYSFVYMIYVDEKIFHKNFNYVGGDENDFMNLINLQHFTLIRKCVTNYNIRLQVFEYISFGVYMMVGDTFQ